MYKGMERLFRHCEIFLKSFQKFLAAPPARIIITPAAVHLRLPNNLYACGYLITRADIDMTYAM